MITSTAIGDWLLLLLAGASLLLLPGLAVRALLASGARRDDASLGAPDGGLGFLLDSLGLSLALWPIILLYASLAHIPITRLTTTGVLGLAAVILLVLAWRAWRARAPGSRQRRRGARRPAPPLGLLTGATLAGLTGLALVTRFLAVRGLVVPNWGDSLHHTLITQLFIEQRGVPHGYMPYAPVYSFTYHFGFHGLAALWAWLTEQSAWAAVLSVGQILNALAVPAAYVLTRELFRSRVAALVSAAVVGFLSGMPEQYVNWGRYTQLAGQVLLPWALVWFIRWIEAPAGDRPYRGAWRRLALAVAGATGLGLTHYRILIFYALFVIAYLAAETLAILRARQVPPALRGARYRRLLGRAGAVAGLGGLLYAPWLGSLLADYLPGLFGRLSKVTTSYLDEYAAQAFLTQYIGQVLPVLATLGTVLVLVWGPRRARRMAGVILAWTVLLAIAARPDALHLPGAGALGTFTVGIALYLPLATLAAPGLARPILWLVRAARTALTRRRRVAGAGLGPVLPVMLNLLLALGLTLANPRAATPDPGFAYVTPDDLATLQWVRGHTPPDTRFLISGALTYHGQAITATDAGMWLPLLAGEDRTASIPPLSAGAEGKQAQDLAERTLALYQASLTPTLASNVNLLRREQIGYIFLGEHTATISPTQLLKDSADYCLLYRQGDSYVFRLQPPGAACPAR